MDDVPEYMPSVSPTIVRHSVRGTDYAVTEWGDSEAPIFFYLHGWGDCALTFQFVVDALDGDWRVVAPDWRGFGRSGHNATTYWFPDYLADLDFLVDHYSPGEPVRLVGHSMGGNVAGLYAGTKPERVRAFVNVEGFGLTDVDPDDAPSRYRQWIDEQRERPAFSEFGDINALADRIGRRAPAAGVEVRRFVARAWADESDNGLVMRADPRHKLPNPVLYRRAEARACWKNVRAPVLLVAGADSPFGFEHPAVRDDLPFPDAERLVLPGVGHMLHLEAPAELAAAIERLFTQTL